MCYPCALMLTPEPVAHVATVSVDSEKAILNRAELSYWLGEALKVVKVHTNVLLKQIQEISSAAGKVISQITADVRVSTLHQIAPAQEELGGYPSSLHELLCF